MSNGKEGLPAEEQRLAQGGAGLSVCAHLKGVCEALKCRKFKKRIKDLKDNGFSKVH